MLAKRYYLDSSVLYKYIGSTYSIANIGLNTRLNGPYIFVTTQDHPKRQATNVILIPWPNISIPDTPIVHSQCENKHTSTSHHIHSLFKL